MPNPASSTSNADNRQDAEIELRDGALDTLASVLRDSGRVSFSLSDSESHDDFVADCEDWARHVLIGTAVGADEEDPANSASGGVRDWNEVRAFYRDRRKAETQYVNTHVSDFKDIIWDFVNELRAVGNSERATSTDIEERLAGLEEAAHSNSLDTLRAAVAPAVQSIRQVLECQRTEYDAQLQRMHSRMESMRDSLLEARQQMAVDPLTELYNRGAFDDTLKRYVSMVELSRQSLILAMVDLDHFKQVNDNHGHPAGDQLLKAVADCLSRSFLRKSDFIARYGGEEFVVLLMDIEAKDAERVLCKFLERVRSAEVSHNGKVLGVTCSVGFAGYRSWESADELLHRADAALYRAKAAGRDRVEVEGDD